MSAMTLVLAAFVVPAFSYAKGPASYVGLPGVLVALSASIVCCCAFLYCPRSPWGKKLVALLLSIIAIFMALDCVLRYAMFVAEP